MPWEALPGAGYPLICLSPVPFAAAVNTVSSWSPDGTLALDGFDDGDPSLDGIYLGRSSDGGGLRRLTILRDFPGDFSPDGRRLVFFRPEPADDNVGSLWVINVDGTGLT